MRETYRRQVDLLLRVLPMVAQESCFALKGGTAINFFVQDFPRLSVDIDLTFLPINSRKESQKEISESLYRIQSSVDRFIPYVKTMIRKSGGVESKLTIKTPDAQIKVEINTIIRGSVFEAKERELSRKLQDEFEQHISIKTLSIEDLYGGKICAALDRQHPRDLFDIKLLLESGGLTSSVKDAFIVYLISHSRPMNEILNPNPLELDEVFVREFEGMTSHSVDINELKKIQINLPMQIMDMLSDSDKEFILSVKSKEPQWDLIPIGHIKDLPSVKWKLINLSKMDESKHKKALKKLENVLS